MPPLRPPIRAPLVLIALLVAFVLTLSLRSRAAEDGEQALELGTAWIYEDLDAAVGKANETGKPLLVAFR